MTAPPSARQAVVGLPGLAAHGLPGIDAPRTPVHRHGAEPTAHVQGQVAFTVRVQRHGPVQQVQAGPTECAVV